MKSCPSISSSNIEEEDECLECPSPKAPLRNTSWRLKGCVMLTRACGRGEAPAGGVAEDKWPSRTRPAKLSGSEGSAGSMVFRIPRGAMVRSAPRGVVVLVTEPPPPPVATLTLLTFMVGAPSVHPGRELIRNGCHPGSGWFGESRVRGVRGAAEKLGRIR